MTGCTEHAVLIRRRQLRFNEGGFNEVGGGGVGPRYLIRRLTVKISHD